MTEVKHLKVGPQDDGQRLDRWIKKNVPGLPYVLALKFMRKGQIRVDGKRAKNDTRLSEGQEIRLPPFKPGQTSMATFTSHKDDAQMMKSIVIYDDGDIVAINKPHGLASQGGKNIARHVDGLTEHLADKKGQRPLLLHRLDRDTSGVLLMARKPETVRRLGKAFMSRDMKKVYWAVTIPAPERDTGQIDAPLNKGTGLFKDMMVVDPKEGKHSLTLFKVMDRVGKQAAFVAFSPRTGRTHQIRVHAAHMGCPLLGDERYGKQDPDAPIQSKRLHLHARSLRFKHPASGKPVTILAPLPKDLRETWKTLGLEESVDEDPFSENGL